MGDQPSPARLVALIVALWAVAVFATVVVPILDGGDEEPTVLALTWRDYPSIEAGSPTVQAQDALAATGLSAEAIVRGREVYVREGCAYCHTQQVRPVVTDVGLGPVTAYGDLMFEAPEVLGNLRIGPDLMHAGSRAPTDDPGWVAEHLRDPRGRRPWSAMPSYDFLSAGDLDDLAQYIASLK